MKSIFFKYCKFLLNIYLALKMILIFPLAQHSLPQQHGSRIY